VPVDPVRDAAIDALLRVFERGVFLDVSLNKTLRRRTLSDRGRRFFTQLVYGTVRHKMLCDYVLQGLLKQPLENLPAPIRTLLRMGIFQALFCRQVTHPALVHTSVDLAKKRGHAGVARLTNAVLRRAPQQLSDLSFPRKPAERLSIEYSIPLWMVKRWVASQGLEGAGELCRAFSIEAPVSARVNTLRTSPETLAESLLKSGVRTEKRTPVPEELTFTEGPPPARSKRFQEGDFMMQDPASMLPSHLLEPVAGQWVLDMCAAPGGKTTHIAALTGGRARIVACDKRVNRLRQVRENVARMECPGVHLVQADGGQPPFGVPFPRVLVDAPCSGLGTLRRHPDLKYRLLEEDIADLSRLQQELLSAAIERCENGGVIVYSVCTFTPEETVEVIERVTDGAPVEPEDGPTWMDVWRLKTGMYQTSPAQDGLDGFFLTRLRKRS
jgi:16S rRNA (cytosine967-C5)-methyltransferase